MRPGGVSISYDKGEANGVWSSLNAETLTGKNVEDNWRVRWMTGYYYKLINKNNERLTVGVSNMLWHYDKDLSGYTLGQGGYYSPQEYVSFALPVTWRKRTENWSWELGGSVSWSHSKTKDELRYPIQSLIPTDEPGRYTDRGRWKPAAAAPARVIPHGRLSNAGSRPTGLWAWAWIFRKRKTIPQAMR